MSHFSHAEIQISNIITFGAYIFCILNNELQLEPIEVCLHIYALLCYILPLVHAHEIGVDLPSAILTHYNTDVIAFLRAWINSDDCAVLKQGRGTQLRLGNHGAELRQEEAIIFAISTIVVVKLQVANQTAFELFHHDTDLCF